MDLKFVDPPEGALEPTLQNIIDQDSLRWIFVGGKGGVGKTTTSCSLAAQLAKHRDSVLLISTDPAHNISDAFSQKFSSDATKVEGFDNLYAMEIDPKSAVKDMVDQGNDQAGLNSMVQDIAFAIPGIDEAMGFAEVMKHVKSMQFSTIVFDTAPTGHTLRFLSFPSILEKALGKVKALTGRFGPMINQISSLMGNQVNYAEMFEKLDSMRSVVSEVNAQFKDPDLTTFIPVMISEFLSLYETERLIQELTTYEIDVHNICVNQLLFPEEDDRSRRFVRRFSQQQKYLAEAYDLYAEDFHIIKTPLLEDEVRGVDRIKKFSELLLTPFDPATFKLE